MPGGEGWRTWPEDHVAVDDWRAEDTVDWEALAEAEAEWVGTPPDDAEPEPECG